MSSCKKCGNITANQNGLCDNCQKTRNTFATDNLELSDILDERKNMDYLFARIENSATPPSWQLPALQQQSRQSEQEKQKVYLEQQNAKSDNYLLGFLGALIGGLIGAIPWALVASKGWFVGWLGYLIAITASKGYDFMKVKLNTKKLWCMAVSVIISVFAAQILSDIFFILTDFKLQGSLGEILKYYANNFKEYLSVSMPNLIIGYIFAALGSFSAFKEIKEETARLEQIRNQINGGDI